LNLTLEPSYGFKGCVGLPHGVVFRKAKHVESALGINQELVTSEKWSLFNNTSLEVI